MVGQIGTKGRGVINQIKNSLGSGCFMFGFVWLLIGRWFKVFFYRMKNPGPVESEQKNENTSVKRNDESNH